MIRCYSIGPDIVVTVRGNRTRSRLQIMADLEQYGVAHCQCNIKKLKQSEKAIAFENETGFNKRKLSGKTQYCI